MKTFLIYFFCFFVVFPFSSGHGFTAPAYFDQAAEIIKVGTSKSGEKLPLMIFLPATNRAAKNYYKQVKSYQPYDAYIAILPQGTPLREEYMSDFGKYIAGYEARLLKDIKRAQALYPIDDTRISLQGISLGGDLGRALFIKNQSLYEGVTILGSRMSYGFNKKAQATLKKNKKHVSLMMGTQDNKDRIKGMKAAYKLLSQTTSGAKFFSHDGGHELPKDKELYAFALKRMINDLSVQMQH